MFNEWVLDASHSNDIPCFCPYSGNVIIWGLAIFTDKSPGKLVGVVHLEGQEACDKWIMEHPNWHDQYSKEVLNGISRF